MTFDIDLIDEELLEEGTMFDGSSIVGWKTINKSDMLLKPDLATAYIDPSTSRRRCSCSATC